MTRLLAGVIAIACAGCPGGPNNPSNAPDGTAKDVLAKLASARADVKSFRAESVMDFRFGKDRIKATVLVMGKPGAMVRFNAINPLGGDVLADLACDGTQFYYLDYQHNCQLEGPCTKDSIGQLLHVDLAPDDFMHLALGTPPVIEGDATLEWDAKTGQEKLTIGAGKGSVEKLAIDVRDKRFDVVDASLDPLWSVDNKEFTDSSGHRVPGKTRFRAQQADNDLIVEWKQIEVNVDLPPASFKITLPGVPVCGQQP